MTTRFLRYYQSSNYLRVQTERRRQARQVHIQLIPIWTNNLTGEKKGVRDIQSICMHFSLRYKFPVFKLARFIVTAHTAQNTLQQYCYNVLHCMDDVVNPDESERQLKSLVQLHTHTRIVFINLQSLSLLALSRYTSNFMFIH